MLAREQLGLEDDLPAMAHQGRTHSCASATLQPDCRGTQTGGVAALGRGDALAGRSHDITPERSGLTSRYSEAPAPSGRRRQALPGVRVVEPMHGGPGATPQAVPQPHHAATSLARPPGDQP